MNFSLRVVWARAAQDLTCATAVHICYGYGIKANTDWKQTLGGEWRQYEQTFPVIDASSIQQVAVECRNSKVPLELLSLLRNKVVQAGVIDVATDAVETAEQVADVDRADQHVLALEQAQQINRNARVGAFE